MCTCRAVIFTYHAMQSDRHNHVWILLLLVVKKPLPSHCLYYYWQDTVASYAYSVLRMFKNSRHKSTDLRVFPHSYRDTTVLGG